MIFDEKTDIQQPFAATHRGTSIPDSSVSRRQTANPRLAGILLILASISAFVTGVFMTFISEFIPSFFSAFESTYGESMQYTSSNVGPEFFQTMYLVCGVVIIILAVFPFLGGIMAMKRKMWTLALVGSILGLFSIGIFFISSILSFIALILLVTSRKEFEENRAEQPFT